MALADSPQRVTSAVHSLRSRYRESIRVDALGAIGRVSASAFHHQFKALTSLTPLQYQKRLRLRLLEARRRTASCASKVEAAAFDVGYESP